MVLLYGVWFNNINNNIIIKELFEMTVLHSWISYNSQILKKFQK